VWNLMPHPDAEVMCTMVYGMRERTVELDGRFISANAIYVVDSSQQRCT
jgi:hypothetical protein